MSLERILSECCIARQRVGDILQRLNDDATMFQDRITGILDAYLTNVSNKLNEVMKVLAIIATIFMPLTFIAGIYGMNFNPDVSPLNMPELRWKYGYPAAITAMALAALGMIWYFKRKKWF